MTRSLIIILFLVSKSVFGQQDNFLEEIEVKHESICSKNLELQYVEEVGKFGYVDTTGKLLIQPQFYCATEFVDCIALISQRKKCLSSKNSSKANWYYINKNGDGVLPPPQEKRAKWDKEIRTATNNR